MNKRVLTVGLSMLLCLSGCGRAVIAADMELIGPDGSRQALTAVAPELASKRVVYVGEQHDRYDHHLGQLAVIKALHEQSPRWAIGMEFFQQPFQHHLDDYIAGTLSEYELLEKTEYFERWRFDYRLYRPILRYAKEQGIKLVALNIDGELHQRFSRLGDAELSDAERSQLPPLDLSDAAYRERLQTVFMHHPGADEKSFERFYQAQLLWDESMAEQVARYLRAHPRQGMVVLAGVGHLAYGSGIPNRVERRLGEGIQTALILPADLAQGDDRQGAHYLVATDTNITLTPPGRMGVMLDTADNSVSAQDVAPDSAAEKAGMQKGDMITTIAERPVQSLSDVRLALLDKQPGDEIEVLIRRDKQDMALELTLQ